MAVNVADDFVLPLLIWRRKYKVTSLQSFSEKSLPPYSFCAAGEGIPWRRQRWT